MNAGADKLRQWREHPGSMVRELFGVTPDGWQEEGLEAFPHNQRIAMKASKGVGKTAFEAWIVWNYLLTRPFPKIACVAVSAENLADNLWTELAHWRSKSPLLQAEFEWTKTRIFRRASPENWWCSARTYPKQADKNQQAATLAGLHAEYILFVLDESGGMPEAVMASAEAALSSCTEGHIVQAGNPTHLEGPLYSACTRERRLWYVLEINGDPDNPNRASRVSSDWAREQIEKYGRDNPYVLINVFGQFPPSSLNALIGPDEVRESQARAYRDFEIGNAARVIGVDVARFGDDSSVIARRHGLQCYALVKKRNIDSTQGAGLVARHAIDFKADAIFIDDTGGFGSGWVDQLRNLGRSPIGIHFAGEAHNKVRYVNKRAEMYFDLVEWVRRGGALPPSSELVAALSQTSYTFQGDRLLLEPKDQIKEKLGYSPDDADAVALTFAEPVAPAATSLAHASMRPRHTVEYDPYAGGM